MNFLKTKAMEKITKGGTEYWVDNSNNTWDSKKYTLETAISLSKTLLNCKNCINCKDCKDCNYCRYCINCKDCKDCNYCNDCNNCKDCNYCKDCSYFSKTPQLIVSSKIGSRESQTRVYWDSEKVQVKCGCFRGNLSEFKARVEEVHKDNPIYLEEYREFIQKVISYIQ